MEYVAAGVLVVIGLVLLTVFVVGLARRANLVRRVLGAAGGDFADGTGLIRARVAALQVAARSRKTKADL